MTNGVKIMLLDRVVKWLVGGDLMNTVKQLVSIANEKEWSGEEKRKYVQQEVVKFISNASMFLVNLAIEVAVVIMKSRMGQNGK